MKIKHAVNDIQSMSHDGGKILKSLQNNHLSIVDVVVREALQNSLDATLDNKTETIVDIKVADFVSINLAKHFEEIEEHLASEYQGYQNFISIRDTNTYGLTGDYKSEDVEVLNSSNFHKLVFGIGKNQEKEGAGGSWGYGKTSYFRLGIGLVIYYTRIKTKKGFEERLIASMIENPSNPNRTLKNNDRGIAWWGQYLSEEDDRIYPIIKEGKIKEILSVFNIEPYVNEETGTTIIIPYIASKNQDETDENTHKFPWEYSYEDEITVAVQRWYFPRILNQKYTEILGNSTLLCKINNKPLINFEPVFDIYQELYTSALQGEPLNKNIVVKPIRFGRNALENKTEPVGHIAFKEVSKEELEMFPPNNKHSGLAYIGEKDRQIIDASSSKVVAYCRKPGMVVEYSIDGKWSPGDITIKEEHLLLAFFVPNSNARLMSKYREQNLENLETYLRDIEQADHADWKDHNNISIVSRMQSYIKREIKLHYQDVEEKIGTSVTSGLSRKFGKILMPPRNFGKSSTHDKSAVRNSRASNSKNKKVEVNVLAIEPLEEGLFNVEFRVQLKGNQPSEVFIQVLSQEKNKIDYLDWNRTIGAEVPYPFRIENLYISEINGEDMGMLSHKDLKAFDITINFSPESRANFIFNKDCTNDCEIKGIFTLNARSNEYVPNIAIRAVK